MVTAGEGARDPAAVPGPPPPEAVDERSRALLGKSARENFPVAPFFLPRAWRDDLMAVYGYARLVDDIGDGDLPPGGGDARLLGVDDPAAAGDPLTLLDAFEADLRRVFAADPDPRHPLLRALVPTVRRHRLDAEPFLALIEANRQDQRVTRYADWDELAGYCRLSANPVGHLVLAISGTATPQRLRWSDAICTALQIVEHLQDVAEDLGRDRVYLPAEEMARFSVTEADLAEPAANPRVRALCEQVARHAHHLLNEGTPLVGSVHGRLRLLLAGFVAGGRAALAAVADADHDVLRGAPKATKLRLLREVSATMRRSRRGGDPTEREDAAVPGGSTGRADSPSAGDASMRWER